MKPTISLCMIVKNEEAFLARCLASVVELVDEMIIVDTGSTDRTIEIAEEFGALILNYPWDEDFAAARNFSLNHASGDWILMMDGDDELSHEARGGICELVSAPENIMPGYKMQVVSFLGDEPWGTSSTVTHIRLFRNIPENRYQGAIHEQLPLKLQQEAVNTGLIIYHYGYLNKVINQKSKVDRNLKIAQKELHEDPNNIFKSFNYGAELLRAGKYRRAEKELKQVAASLSGNEAYAPAVYQKLSLCLVKQKKLKAALWTVRAGWEKCSQDLSLLFLQGSILAEMAKPQQAIQIFEQCLLLRDEVKSLVFRGAGDTLALAALSGEFIKLKRPWAAIECLAEAYRIDPQCSLAWKGLINLLRQWASPSETLYYLVEKCGLPETSVRHMLAGWTEEHLSALGLDCIGSKPLISVCLLTLNDSSYLKRCLPALTGLADEIIAVDLGSTDDTELIVRKFGAAFVTFPWKKDFGAARNAAIQTAKGKWILFVDVNMEFPITECGKIRKIAENGKVDAYNFYFDDSSLMNDTAASRKQIIMFRNLKSFRFDHPIYGEPNLKKRSASSVVTEDCDVNIIYHLPDPASAGFKEKQRLKIKILLSRLQLKEKPLTRYYLASEYFILGLFEECLLQLRQAGENCRGKESFYPDLVRKTVLCLFQLCQYERAKQIAYAGLKNYGDELNDLYAVLFNIHLTEEDSESAERSLALWNKEINRRIPDCMLKLRKEESYLFLAHWYLKHDNWKHALCATLKALQNRPDYNHAIILLTDILKKQKIYKEYEVLITQYFGLSSDEKLSGLAEELLRNGYSGLSIKLSDKISPEYKGRTPLVNKTRVLAYLDLSNKLLSLIKEIQPDNLIIEKLYVDF